MNQFTTLVLLAVTFSYPGAFASGGVSDVCQLEFADAPVPYRTAFDNLLAAGLPTDHVVAYIGVTTDEVAALVTTGRLEIPTNPFRPVGELGRHPGVAARLRETHESPAYPDAALAQHFAREYAWEESMRTLILARARAAGRTLSPDIPHLRAFLTRVHAFSTYRREFSPSQAELLEAAPELGNFGSPAEALRTLTGSARAEEFFAHLPKRAGVVLALHEDALPKLVFNSDELARVQSFTLDDLAGAKDLSVK